MKELPIFAHPGSGTTIQAPESDRKRLEADGWYQVNKPAPTKSGGKPKRKPAAKPKKAA